MKLLLDQNLSHRMLGELEAVFPGSEQVKRLDLDTADDKTIWLKCGNRPRWYIENLLLKNQAWLNAFDRERSASVIEIS